MTIYLRVNRNQIKRYQFVEFGEKSIKLQDKGLFVEENIFLEVFCEVN